MTYVVRTTPRLLESTYRSHSRLAAEEECRRQMRHERRRDARYTVITCDYRPPFASKRFIFTTAA